MHHGVNLRDFVETGHPQGLFQIFERAFRLSVLLIQQVVQDVLVALDKPLRVLLTMFQLLVTVTLDALKECGKGQLLLMAQLGLFLLNDSLHLGFQLVTLKLLQ